MWHSNGAGRLPQQQASPENAPAGSVEAAAAADQQSLAHHAEVIRSLGKRVVGDIIEIGRRLIEAKKIAGHGYWRSWLKREFSWKETTALNFMRVHELSKSANFVDLRLPVSSLYLLAAPSTPHEAREDVIERAESGETISRADILAGIGKARAEGRAERAKRSEQRKAEHAAKVKSGAEQITQIVMMETMAPMPDAKDVIPREPEAPPPVVVEILPLEQTASKIMTLREALDSLMSTYQAVRHHRLSFTGVDELLEDPPSYGPGNLKMLGGWLSDVEKEWRKKKDSRRGDSK
jgi:hypothetical protein